MSGRRSFCANVDVAAWRAHSANTGARNCAPACVTPGSVAAQVAGISGRTGTQRIDIEHPTGFFTVELDVVQESGDLRVNRSALLRTARKLMAGEVFVPSTAWGGAR